MAKNSEFPAPIVRLPPLAGHEGAWKLDAEGCEVVFATYPAGTTLPPHSHETDNVGVVTRGAILLTVDGNTERIGPGDWYHVPAGKEHAAEFPEDTTEVEFWFHELPRGEP